MPWQLTSLARRARGVFGVRALDEVPAEPWAPAAGRSETSPVPVVREAARVLAALTPAERAAYEGLLEDLPDARDVLARALVTTGGLTTAADLATAWSGWDAAARAAVAHPVRRLTAAARQTDPTTCGSAALALLAAAGDPALAAWLATGWTARALPSELAGATPRALAVLAERPATERFGVLQRVLLRRTNARAVGPFPWPSSLGTPPWGAARAARYPGVRYRAVMLDDSDAAHLGGVLAEMARWVGDGVPVPLYAGGDSTGGWQAAMPRHVVLAVAAHERGLEVFEPSVGRLLPLAFDGTGPRPALGGWSHLAWAVLPR